MPGVLTSSPNKSENYACTRGQEPAKADPIDFLELERERACFFRGIVCRGADAFTKEEEEDNMGNHANRKIDSEAPSPRDGG